MQTDNRQKKYLEHKGLIGSINRDSKVWFGIVRISSMITVSYTADTEEALQRAFEQVVDEFSVRM